jgi:hypothetical protein
MKLEKAKKVIKIKKSQLQNQKQVQNVVVNLNAPKTTRKRAPTKLKSQQGPKKPPQPQVFQAPIYSPPVASFNPKTPETNFVLSEIMKHLKATTPANNQIEKPSEEQKELTKILQVKPTLPEAFNTPEQPKKLISLSEEVKSDPLNTRQNKSTQTFIKPSQFEATQTPFKFNPIEMTPSSLIQEVKTRQPKPINITKEMKYQEPPEQMWAELEKGGHYGLLGINTEQLKAHKEAKKEATYEALSMPVLVEEIRPTGEEIDLGIVPFISQEIVKEDRVESNEPEIVQILKEEPKEKTLISKPMKTKSGTQQMQLKELTMGKDKEFNKSFLYRSPKQSMPITTVPYTKEQFDELRGARIKKFEKPLAIKAEAEPLISEQTNLPLSPEKEVSADTDPETKKLSRLTNKKLMGILKSLGGTATYKRTDSFGKIIPTYKNKTVLREEIEGLRKTNPDDFTKALNRY